VEVGRLSKLMPIDVKVMVRENVFLLSYPF